MIEARGALLTLRWRLTLLYTALITLLLTGVFVAVYAQFSSTVRQTLELELNSNIDQIRRLIEASDDRRPANGGDWTISQETFAEVQQFFGKTNDVTVESFTSFQPISVKNVTLEQLQADVRLDADGYATLLRTSEFAGRGFLSNEGLKSVEIGRAHV